MNLPKPIGFVSTIHQMNVFSRARGGNVNWFAWEVSTKYES